MKQHHVFYTALAGLLLASTPVCAYVGPGPGLTMIGSLIGLIGSVVVALLMVVIWPIRLYLKKKKAAVNSAPQDNDATPPTPPAE